MIFIFLKLIYWFNTISIKTLYESFVEIEELILKCREGNGTPLQYSCLENPMDGGAWKAAVHGVAEVRTQLSDFTLTFHFHALEKEMATHSSILAWKIPWQRGAWGGTVHGVARVGWHLAITPPLPNECEPCHPLDNWGGMLLLLLLLSRFSRVRLCATP